MTYAQLQQRLDTPIKKDSKRLEKRHTYVERRGENIAIRLHDTDILTFAPDGSIRFDTGGWQTVTTKQRMNEYAPTRIYSERGLWYIDLHGTRFPYRDGAILTTRGELLNVGDADVEKAKRKAVTDFAKQYVTRLRDGKLPAPSAGDCLYCQMIVTNTEGKTSPSTDHIQSHIDEGYYVPSLMIRALDGPGFAPVEKWAVGSRWAATEVERTTCAGAARIHESWIWQRLEKGFRRYLLAQLGMAR